MSKPSSFDVPTQPEGEGTNDIEFLPNWDEQKWKKLLAYTTTRSFRTGDVVINIGDTDSSFYIITRGGLEVLLPAEDGGEMQSIRTFSKGAVVGEVAFIDRSPRSATIRASADGEMLQMSVDDFEVFFGHEPDLGKEILLELARLLTLKLRHANKLISKSVK